MNPGVLLCPSYMGEAMLAGMHGYDPKDPDSTAMFASNTEMSETPPRLDKIFALMNRQIDSL
jgi:hypothetical protein